MRTLLSLLTRGLGLLALVGLGALLLYGLVLGVQIATYESADDADHVERKRRYLAELAASRNDPKGPRPNLVLILFDDLGYGDLGAYGAESIETPNLDRLAESGLRLANYYAPSPVCTSSRVALLTGRYPGRALLNIVAFPTDHPMEWALRAQGALTRVAEEEILLPEISAAGYATSMVGKWHPGTARLRCPSIGA